ncbi:phage protein [Rahnella aquatilis CIP 78.65 = ATCC 33071]|uniref:Sce7726 family protein n=1 Tax=Rahnella aquatilis (strain ATCC 33071 / DSM 4594 / JCM 1683 / NBRC 105701 / NCIMB 13365 / CIP 78.65) TaxID=745277 RepID=H2ISP7_RAHAC|nr:sce7726 family protein [Rahnella aquatilis]AEX53751.1 hypothetical protein Rahaq2_3977 [Rahnella aquatilis CIP 78.65 = ATCC 33071]KFD02557.1 phage protein [Rahnella aquatilis CIP 78.65 = ATCC 33071]
MSDLLREQDIKVALINWLYNKGLLENATLINEMVVANWSRRVDLAIANGHLQAFEIKSDFDTLKRLDGQLATFTSRFEKVTVVCSSRFTYEVTKKVQPDVGIIEFSNTIRGVKFKVVQRGRLSNINNKRVFLGFLLKKELAKILLENEIYTQNGSSRSYLENLAENISLAKIRDFTLRAIKTRYQETSDSYVGMLIQNKKITNQDLNLLSKAKKKKELESIYLNVLSNSSTQSNLSFHKIDVEDFINKHGGDINVIPQNVLKRVIK